MRIKIRYRITMWVTWTHRTLGNLEEMRPVSGFHLGLSEYAFITEHFETAVNLLQWYTIRSHELEKKNGYNGYIN